MKSDAFEDGTESRSKNWSNGIALNQLIKSFNEQTNDVSSVKEGSGAMARFKMIRSSSRKLCSVMLAVIVTSLSLTPVASGAKNSSSILNFITDTTKMKHVVFVRCSFNFESSRTVEPKGTVLKPGEEKVVNVDDYPGVRQVECDITRYASSENRLFNIKTVVWFFNGPSQTRFRFENDDMHFAVPPSLDNFNQDTGSRWDQDNQYFYVPNFFEPSSTASI